MKTVSFIRLHVIIQVKYRIPLGAYRVHTRFL